MTPRADDNHGGVCTLLDEDLAWVATDDPSFDHGGSSGGERFLERLVQSLFRRFLVVPVLRVYTLPVTDDARQQLPEPPFGTRRDISNPT